MSRARAGLWGLACLLLAASALMQVEAGNAGDKNWLLLAARMLLQGRKLSVDIFEVNPPLIIWFYTIPVWLSNHFSVLADFEWLALIGLAATGVSTALGMRLIARHPAFAGDTRAQIGFGLLMAIVFLFFTTQIYFFDRDHIFFVCGFPYFLRFMPSLARQKLPLSLRLGVALLAAFGFCIKPFTLVVFAVLQLLSILRERRLAILWSLENIIIYLAAVLYFFCVWYFDPDYATVMHIAAATYGAYNRRINGYLYLALAFISAGLTFVDYRLRCATPYRRDTLYFIGVAASFLAYALAGNGWGYTYHPLLCMLLFLSGWVASEYGWLAREAKAKGLSGWPFFKGQIACASNIGVNALYMILCLVMFFSANQCAKTDECKERGPYIAYMHEHHARSFATMSMNLRRWTTLVRVTGAEWDTRFNHLWMLPAILQSGDPFGDRFGGISGWLGKAYAEDLERWKPDIVFADTSDGIFAYPHPVDMVMFLSHNPEFATAWHHYRYADTIDQCPLAENSDKQLKSYNNNANDGKRPFGIDCRFAIYRRVN